MAYKTKYKIQNFKKYIGDPSNIICRSLWERRVCKYLDENRNVVRWGSEEFYVPYKSPVDGKPHKYYPDFIAEIRKENEVKTYVIEVKPKKQCKPPKNKKRKSYINECITYSVNQAKWKSAKIYCAKNDWEFIILTEDNILP